MTALSDTTNAIGGSFSATLSIVRRPDYIHQPALNGGFRSKDMDEADCLTQASLI